ncbi:hypothetical protein [Nitrososphaera sp.]|uniref:hypothetical protein n=1 Tax=Nitrososphaera sp. TaxID=1971748 RepID=UPI00317EF399
MTEIFLRNDRKLTSYNMLPGFCSGIFAMIAIAIAGMGLIAAGIAFEGLISISLLVSGIVAVVLAGIAVFIVKFF